MIPNLAVIQVENPRWRMPRLWIPLVLLYIPLLLLSPLILLVLWVACLACGIRFWTAMAAFWSILCSLPGTEVRVCANANRVSVRIL